MIKKLTITIADKVYEGLDRRVGPRRISRFLEALARPHVIGEDLEEAYRAMAADEERERTALEWSESLIGDEKGLMPGTFTSAFKPSLPIRASWPAILPMAGVTGRLRQALRPQQPPGSNRSPWRVS